MTFGRGWSTRCGGDRIRAVISVPEFIEPSSERSIGAGRSRACHSGLDWWRIDGGWHGRRHTRPRAGISSSSGVHQWNSRVLAGGCDRRRSQRHACVDRPAGAESPTNAESPFAPRRHRAARPVCSRYCWCRIGGTIAGRNGTADELCFVSLQRISSHAFCSPLRRGSALRRRHRQYVRLERTIE